MYGMGDAYSGMSKGLRESRKEMRATFNRYVKMHGKKSDDAKVMIVAFRALEQKIVDAYDSWGSEDPKKGVDGKPIKPSWSQN